jgi:hypothetical protein
VDIDDSLDLPDPAFHDVGRFYPLVVTQKFGIPR